MKKLKVLSLFSGIGAFEKALTNLNIDFELVGFSEINKYAINSYCAVHNVDESKNLGDVTKIDETTLDDFDLLVGGFACQAFSVSGLRKGFEDARGTLFFDLARIAEYKQPKYIVCENVKGLINHDKGKTLSTIIQTLCDIGYTVDYELLNAKYFNIPQNRERIFIIGIRDDLIKQEKWNTNNKNIITESKNNIEKLKGIKTFNFNWTKQEDVTARLHDILENNVDDKFYLSKGKTEMIVSQLEKRNELSKIHNSLENNKIVAEQYSMGNGISYCLDANYAKGASPNYVGTGRRTHIVTIENGSYRIRKLTPLECWRLMGFDDEDYHKAEEQCSNTQLYKQAGNSIVVNVVQELLHNLLIMELLND